MLNKVGRSVQKFKKNMPGNDWVSLLLKRHWAQPTNRITQNIKVSRAEVSASDINDYFSNLKESTKNIPDHSLWNYDETDFTNDPGRKKALHKQGC